MILIPILKAVLSIFISGLLLAVTPTVLGRAELLIVEHVALIFFAKNRLPFFVRGHLQISDSTRVLASKVLRLLCY